MLTSAETPRATSSPRPTSTWYCATTLGGGKLGSWSPPAAHAKGHVWLNASMTA